MVTSVLHFIYLTDKLKVLSRLQENVYYYRLIRVTGHICKRINKLTIDIKKDKIDDDDDDLIISIDSTGIKVTNRGQWMDE